MGWREQKAEARAVVHETMKWRAIYTSPEAEETPCFVRVHKRQDRAGDLVGFDYGVAERQEMSPQIIVESAVVSPERGGYFTIEGGEAYQVENPEPDDDAYITCPVSRITRPDVLASLTFPAEA